MWDLFQERLGKHGRVLYDTLLRRVELDLERVNQAPIPHNRTPNTPDTCFVE